MHTKTQTVLIKNLAKHIGETVQINGWLHNKSSKGKLHFLQIRDGSGIVQAVVFKNDITDDMFHSADKLPQETALTITGLVKKDERSSLGVELQVTNLSVISIPTQEFPISPKEHGVAFLMDKRHLWLRSKRQTAILKIRSTLVCAIRDYFRNNDFTLVDAPIFTPAACEGTTNLFEVNYFDDKAYLTQSGQLYMEAAAMALGKVYCFGPTFRAEKSKTRRHLTEFWMLEPEVAFMELEGAMDLAEDFLVFIVSEVLKQCEKELIVLERNLDLLRNIQKPFPRITYEQALQILKESGKSLQFGDDFGAEDESILSQRFDRPVIVHRYPKDIKAFYMKPDPQDPRLALCMDILAPEGIGEIIGGGQREDNLHRLEEQIHMHNLPKEAFLWYLDLRKYGSVPHAGFGLGLERAVGWICGLHHVREAIPFPRMMERISP